jgi:hypothetical protein
MMEAFVRYLAAAALAVAIGLPSVDEAGAQGICLEGLGRSGCPDRETFTQAQLRRLSCQNLWHVRNSIFKARGYCFKTDVAIAAYGNDGCAWEDEAKVPLNTHERNNVLAIRRVERAKGC